MSKRIKLFLTLCLLATLASGVGAATAAADAQSCRTTMLDKNFVLRVGEEIVLAKQGLKIKFVSVPEDSRCPTNVNCIWAGNARVMLHVGKVTGKPFKLELNTNPGAATNMAAGERGSGIYEINLVEVSPHPVAGQPIALRSYVVTLVVSKKVNRSLN